MTAESWVIQKVDQWDAQMVEMLGLIAVETMVLCLAENLAPDLVDGTAELSDAKRAERSVVRRVSP